MKFYINKGRNVVYVITFSLSLCEYLKSKNTSVGTVNRARREILIYMKITKELYSTFVLKKDDASLTIYQRKTNRNVLILSSM